MSRTFYQQTNLPETLVPGFRARLSQGQHSVLTEELRAQRAKKAQHWLETARRLPYDGSKKRNRELAVQIVDDKDNFSQLAFVSDGVEDGRGAQGGPSRVASRTCCAHGLTCKSGA